MRKVPSFLTVGWFLKKFVFVIFEVIKFVVNYLSLILELYLIYTSALMFFSFYFYGEVSLNMTTEEYFRSEIFFNTFNTSCVMAFMITIWRLLFWNFFFGGKKVGLDYQGVVCAATPPLGDEPKEKRRVIYNSETDKSYVGEAK